MGTEHNFTDKEGRPRVYRTHQAASGPDEPAKPILFIANGLGVRLSVWDGILLGDPRLLEGYTIVTAFYRGQFDPPVERLEHDLDAKEFAAHYGEVLRAFRRDFERPDAIFDLVVGWSMGVQLAIEFALQEPKSVGALALIAGAQGELLGTFLQCWCFSRRFAAFVVSMADFIMKNSDTVFWTLGYPLWMLGAQDLTALSWFPWFLYKGEPGRCWFWGSHCDDIYMPGNGGSSVAFENAFTILMACERHSVRDRLKNLTQPTLILGGRFDFLTPLWRSRKLAEEIPNGQLAIFNTSHFIPVENPRGAAERIAGFAAGDSKKAS